MKWDILCHLQQQGGLECSEGPFEKLHRRGGPVHARERISQPPFSAGQSQENMCSTNQAKQKMMSTMGLGLNFLYRFTSHCMFYDSGFVVVSWDVDGGRTVACIETRSKW